MLAHEVGRRVCNPVSGPGVQALGALAEFVTAAAQGLFEDQAVLGLGATAVGARSSSARTRASGMSRIRSFHEGETISHIAHGECD